MTTFKTDITKGLLAATLLFNLSSCKSSDDNPSPNAGSTPPASTEQSSSPEGGISAGGGGTLPANPIYPYRVTEIVGEAKRQLRLYFNYQRKWKESSIGAVDNSACSFSI